MRRITKFLTLLLLAMCGIGANATTLVTVVDGTNAPFNTYTTRSNGNLTLTTNSASGLAGVTTTLESGAFDRASGWYVDYALTVKAGASQTADKLTITAPEGYRIASYSLTCRANTSSCTYKVSSTVDESDVATNGTQVGTGSAVTFSKSSINSQSTNLTIYANGTTVNWLVVTAFTITLEEVKDAYTITTQRGYIYAESASATQFSRVKNGTPDATNALHQWVFVTLGSNTYLYNVGTKKFASFSANKGHDLVTSMPATVTQETSSTYPNTDYTTVLHFTKSGTTSTMNMNDDGVMIDTWTTHDEGNVCKIENAASVVAEAYVTSFSYSNTSQTSVFVDGTEVTTGTDVVLTSGAIVSNSSTINNIATYNGYSTLAEALAATDFNGTVELALSAYEIQITTAPATEVSFTWNGETKTGTSVSFTRSVEDGAVSNGTITASYTDATGCYSGGTLSTASWDGTNSVSATYKLTPNFFSTNYGDKWIRVAFAPNTSYVMTLPSATDYTGVVAKTATIDVSDPKQLWCFVGTADNFKIYNKEAGESLTLTYSNYANNATVSMGTTQTAWMLDDTYLGYSTEPGYFIEPANESTKRSLNSLGSAGGNVGFWNAGAGNGGSRWLISDASGELTLTALVDGSSDINDYRKKLGKVNVTYGSTTSSVALTKDNLNSTVYLPNNTAYYMTAGYNWYGYNFSSFTGNSSGTVTTGTPVTVTANYTLANDRVRYLFYDDDQYSKTTGKMIPYRIPAIAQAKNGDLFAINDRRWRGHDIGLNYANRYSESIDVIARRSKDRGNTWESELTLLQGDGVAQSNSCAYGDAAVVADSLSNKILIMTASGYYSYANNSTTNRIRMSRTWLEYDEANDEWTVSGPTDVADAIYGLFDSESNAQKGLFFASGRITQSSIVKVGDYYRLYAALLTRAGIYAVYSDDFGATWSILGDASTPASSSGDEPKTEELPDGSVLLSVRKAGGRIFNKYTYTADAISNGTYDAGAWGSATGSSGITAADCNGEVLILPVTRVSDNANLYLMLQSVPAASGRNNVSIYYKALESASDYADAATIASGWSNSNKLQLSTSTSAYSTMVQMDNDTIAFYFEEMINSAGLGYDMCYVPLSIEEITNNTYKSLSSTPTERYLGDCNFDGSVDATDISMMVNFVLNGNPTTVSAYRYDYNAYNTNKDTSAEIEVSDIAALVNLVLNGTLELIENSEDTNPTNLPIVPGDGTGTAFSPKM